MKGFRPWAFIRDINTINLIEIFEWCDNTFGKNAWYYDIQYINMNNGFFKGDYSKAYLISINANVDIAFNFLSKEDEVLFNLTWIH